MLQSLPRCLSLSTSSQEFKTYFNNSWVHLVPKLLSILYCNCCLKINSRPDPVLPFHCRNGPLSLNIRMPRAASLSLFSTYHHLQSKRSVLLVVASRKPAYLPAWSPFSEGMAQIQIKLPSSLRESTQRSSSSRIGWTGTPVWREPAALTASDLPDKMSQIPPMPPNQRTSWSNHSNQGYHRKENGQIDWHFSLASNLGTISWCWGIPQKLTILVLIGEDLKQNYLHPWLQSQLAVTKLENEFQSQPCPIRYHTHKQTLEQLSCCDVGEQIQTLTILM